VNVVKKKMKLYDIEEDDQLLWQMMEVTNSMRKNQMPIQAQIHTL